MPVVVVLVLENRGGNAKAVSANLGFLGVGAGKLLSYMQSFIS